jgi:hypothetical protein
VTLQVALLAPISWRVPPRQYGPWEQFASLLTEGLVRRGVDVTLFATADSITTARLVGTAPTGYSEDPGLHAKAWEALHISAVFERASEFDVIHNGFDFLPLTYSDLVDTPVVTTIHGFSSEQIVPVFEKYNARGYYVAISNADRHERLDYVATIHHGIDMGRFELRRAPGDYLLFFGRIHPDKGTVEAIDVAERAGIPLVIAGIVQDQGYFEQRVEPRLDGESVSYVGGGGGGGKGGVLAGVLSLFSPAAAACSAVPVLCCTSSTSTSRSGSASSKRWRAVRRSSRRGAVPCRRSSVTARTASSSTPSRTPLPPFTRRAPSTGQPYAHRWNGASTSSGWWTNTSPSISASSNSTATQRSTSRPSAERGITA